MVNRKHKRIVWGGSRQPLSTGEPEAACRRAADAAGSGCPPTSPLEHAREYDCDATAAQAETAYQRAVDSA